MNTYSNSQYILQKKSKCISHLMETHIYYKNTIIEQKLYDHDLLHDHLNCYKKM